MQEEKENMVDIDTSGPGADVELPEEKQEDVVETKEESSSSIPESTEEKVEASDEKQETKQGEKPEAKKDELQDYSKDVQRRIAKLTKKWREAERQKDEAITFAQIQKEEKEKQQKLLLNSKNCLELHHNELNKQILKQSLGELKTDGLVLILQ
jgi:hypothetical protein